MTPLSVALLVLILNSASSAFWYMLGLYNGHVRGYVACYISIERVIVSGMNAVKIFARGWHQGHAVAESKWKRGRDPVSGRFV